MEEEEFDRDAKVVDEKEAVDSSDVVADEPIIVGSRGLGKAGSTELKSRSMESASSLSSAGGGKKGGTKALDTVESAAAGVLKIFSPVLKVVMWVLNTIMIFTIFIFKETSMVLNRFLKNISYKLGSLFSMHPRERVQQLMTYAGVERAPEEILGLTLIYSVIVGISMFVLTYFFMQSSTMALIASIISFVLLWSVPYVILTLLIEKRVESVESILPDVLNMIAQNMKAGMTSYNALWVSARPEFGPLAVEIQKAAKDTLAGAPLDEALIAISNRVKSEKLSRSVKLMIQGMKSGGELPDVLQGISKDMRAEINLKNRMKSETSAHALFILFALLAGAPLLFAVSHEFISIFSTLFSRLDISNLGSDTTQSMMISLSGLSISREFFFMYAIATLAVSCFFGGLLISLIRTGKALRGVRNSPVLIVISVLVFILLGKLLSGFFGSMMAI